MTMNAETPRAESGAFQENLADGEAAAIVAQIRRRREASARCKPLPCGHRDPLDCFAAPAGPGTFGLTPAELRAEANRLVTSCGWQLWEVLDRLAINPQEQHRRCCQDRREAA
jgi:hypothetical protein